jgi:exosortase/archaeosortase family protein
MIRFLVVFGLLVAIGRWEPVVTDIREMYCEVLARSVAFALSLAGMEPVLTGSTIQAGFGRGLTVVQDCDGLVLLFLFIAGVAAMPIQRRLRPYAWAAGVLLLITFINWLRLVALTLTSFYQPRLFDVIHVYVIQGLLILTVVLLFLAWLSLAIPEGPASAGEPEGQPA